MDIITRKEAKLKSLKRYYTGKECKRGHLSERFTDSGGCIECRSKKESEYSKRYYDSHRDEILKYQKIYASENKDKISTYQKEYQNKNRDKLAEYRKYYYETNKPKFAERSKNYRLKNKDDFNYRYTRVLREMVRRGLFVSKNNESFLSNHGYEVCELVKRFEMMFRDGMSWDNHGEWHIDHIRPVSYFINNGIYDPKIINALDNLQPLWADENLKKGAK